MINVTSKNFEDLLPDILKNIENASFVAIDTEFTGLPSGQQKSLFDSLEERYEKLRHELQGIIIIQFGLTTFKKDLKLNRYNATSYTFYLRPTCFGPVDKVFSLQGSALEFLYKYNFDFNMSFRDGVQFLNEEEFQLVQKEMKSRKSLLHILCSERDRDKVLDVCSNISKWMMKTSEERTTLDESTVTGIEDYILFRIIRERIRGCWIHRDHDKKIVIEKVTSTRLKELEMKNVSQEDAKYLESLQGFTRVFRKLVECKKPLVGHNCLCDLILIYQQFHRSLPSKLKTFQDDILQLFPVIFDTKHICLLIRRDVDDVVDLEGGDLSKTYTTLFSHPSSSGLYYSPEVGIPGQDSVDITPHHAGFDSYACGFVFLKLAHIVAIKNLEGRPKPMTWVEHLDALATFRNRINLIRSGNHYLDLSGGYAEISRPKWLHIQSLSSSSPLDIEQITDLMSSYGTVDIKPLNRTSAIVAVGNWGCARDIVRAFQQSTEFRITSYSHLRHSISGRLLLWSTMASCVGFSLALLVQLVKLAR